MKRFYFVLIGLICILGPVELRAQSPVQITIDVSALKKPVSPYIYGKNNSLSDNPASPVAATDWTKYRDAGLMMFRESGGNNSTKYNWRKKLTSHPDWYNNVYSHDWDYAAGTLLKNIPNASGMWTLPLIGKAAKNKSNNFNDWGYNSSNWWSGVAQNLAGGGTVNPAGGGDALKEGNPDLYLENWPADSVVGILSKWFGPSGLGYDQSKLLYWNMDNEPEIWSGTHDDVMPVQIGAEEFMQRWFETAKKARALFPDIKLVGPVPANEWQWYNWNNGAISSGGKNYVWLEYFIKRIADEQKATGIRLLDVIDIHFYPGESATADIVQLHRVYFDRTYIYPGHNGVHRIGGWDTTINKEYIFGRCQEWLDKYMGPGHGVTFAVTETDTKAADANVRAVWYASTLGEFARQGVEIFTPWSWGAGMYEVVHLFSRYNQKYFINALSSEELNVSAYPTINSTNDSMTIVMVNRSAGITKETKITLQNFIPGNGPVNYLMLNALPATETFRSHTNNALKKGSITPEGNILTINLPPLSVTSLLISSQSTASTIRSVDDAQVFRVMVFPNPADDSFTLAWPAGKAGNVQVAVYNASGAVVMEQTVKGQSGAGNNLVISTKAWPPGFYIVKAGSEHINSFAKINVIH